jgi:hypothetical protein
VAFKGVKDPLSWVSSPGLGIQTSMAAPGWRQKSSYPHKTDSAFTDWKAGTKDDYEYRTWPQPGHVLSFTPFDGEKLWILNDWFYNGDAIGRILQPVLGLHRGGSQCWDIRAYGDQRIEYA